MDVNFSLSMCLAHTRFRTFLRGLERRVRGFCT